MFFQTLEKRLELSCAAILVLQWSALITLWWTLCGNQLLLTGENKRIFYSLDCKLGQYEVENWYAETEMIN